MKTPLPRYTFSNKRIRRWVEDNCEGFTLNLFAGQTLLHINEFRIDSNIEMIADRYMDALEYTRETTQVFDTILLDPPYSSRKSMEMYKGHRMSPFRQLKDELPRILVPGGLVITFGYHSVSMGATRGFKTEQILLMSHGGAIHDTIATVERYEK